MKLAFLIGSSLCTMALAQSPSKTPTHSTIGMVSAAGPFELAGAPVRTDGVPSWALVAGSAVKTNQHPAVIRMKDGSRVYLRAYSQAVVEEHGEQLNFRLLSGSMFVTPSSKSSVQYYKNSELVPAVKTPTATAPIASFDVKMATASSPAAGKSTLASVPLSSRRPAPPPVSSR